MDLLARAPERAPDALAQHPLGRHDPHRPARVCICLILFEFRLDLFEYVWGLGFGVWGLRVGVGGGGWGGGGV